MRRAWGGRADHQVDRAGPVGRRRPPRTSPGTTRSPIRNRSRGRSATCWRNPQLFLNTTSDARLLPMVVDAASGDLTAPTDDELRADVVEQGITPLFDGAELERI